MTGSSGLGKGIRSIATRVHEGPGTSIPCQSEIVPSRIERGSFANLSTSGPTASPRRWVMIGIFNSASTRRKCSSAISTPRQELKSASVRPPAASINSPSSVRASFAGPSRPGSAKWRGKYNIPCEAKSKGDPTSSICTLAGSTAPLLSSSSSAIS